MPALAVDVHEVRTKATVLGGERGRHEGEGWDEGQWAVAGGPSGCGENGTGKRPGAGDGRCDAT